MTVIELIRRRLVVPSLQASDKLDAIRELLDFLIEQGELAADRRPDVLDAVFCRERYMSTGMEHGIALPHGVTDAVEEELAAIGISKEGITFGTMDGRPVHIIILLLTPTLKALTRVRTLAEIARVVNCAESRRRLIASEHSDEAIRIILGN